jgi:acetyl esterase/lipase
MLIVLYFIYYPYPLIWYLKAKTPKPNPDYLESLSTSGELLTKFEFDYGNNKKFVGNVYRFTANTDNGAGENSGDGNGDGSGDGGELKNKKSDPKGCFIWFHGGSFVDGIVHSKAIFFNPIINDGYDIIQFDYPTLFKYNQDEVHSFINGLMDWLLKNYSYPVVHIGGDLAGTIYSTAFLAKQLSTEFESEINWPRIDFDFTNSKLIGLSGFYGKTNVQILKFLWENYVERGSTKIKTIPIQSKTLLVAGTKDMLYDSTISLKEDNSENTDIHVLIFQDAQHEFMFTDPLSNIGKKTTELLLGFINDSDVILDGTLDSEGNFI